jgi:hypothetical protein
MIQRKSGFRKSRKTGYQMKHGGESIEKMGLELGKIVIK